MCLLVFAHRVHPDFPLLLAANRDEFHARATRSASFWSEHPTLLAGKDLEQGGTWMGITRSGRFAAVTNCRNSSAPKEAPRSRGELPLNYLTGEHSTAQYLEWVVAHADEYAGFNLLVGDGKQLWYFSNDKDLAHRQAPTPLQPGIYGLSNAQLDTPWPKVERGKQRLNTLLENNALDHDMLLSLVNNKEQSETRLAGQEHLDAQLEKLLSAQFIQSDTYGTRASTTLKINNQRGVSWREVNFDGSASVTDSHTENFSVVPEPL